MKSKKVELLLPAGNEECLRAAVNNGADAVYLGLGKFNARASAGNFDEKNIFGAVKYCHDRNVKVYAALNILVKNSELKDYFDLMSLAYSAKADAVIIQDPAFIPIIRENFPNIEIHLSTQAATTNKYAIPKVERTVLARELSLEEIKEISKEHEKEVFVHGALCFSYSGLCLFSSIAGGRSGNRGLCAQPCRKKYNKKYAMSTMDLNMIEKIPQLIEAGVASFKIEGRLRSPFYVATVARVYRKAIDSYYKGSFEVSKKDHDDLKLAFNREFTEGFAFGKEVLNPGRPTNRGLYIGTFRKGKLVLENSLSVGEGIAIWCEDVKGKKITKIIKDGKIIQKAISRDIIDIGVKGNDGCKVYKTSRDTEIVLGDNIKKITPSNVIKPILQSIQKKDNNDPIRIFAMARSKMDAIEADKAGADVIYYDIFDESFADVKKSIKYAELFARLPRVISGKQLELAEKMIKKLKPEGILAGERGAYYLAKRLDLKVHLDYSFNIFNDLDVGNYDALPIISPELNLNEISLMKNKNVISFVHGDIILMTTKNRIEELVDEEGRKFKVRKTQDNYEVLNSRPLGLFNDSIKLKKAGIKYFYIDSSTPGKFVRIYKKILSGQEFNDKRIRKGHTTGHLRRGVK
ncbi:U32 family peptidase [candidate division KSB1 bacterium]